MQQRIISRKPPAAAVCSLAVYNLHSLTALLLPTDTGPPHEVAIPQPGNEMHTESSSSRLPVSSGLTLAPAFSNAHRRSTVIEA